MTVDAALIRRATAVLRAGGLVAIPTETVYGLGADASNDDAVGRIFAVKGRPAGHPLIVHIASAAAVPAWSTTRDPRVTRLAEAFWPGPLTLIVPKIDGIADAATGGRSTIGLRVPDHRLTQALLRDFGGGIAAPSANRFGRVSPTTAAHVRDDLGDAVDLILDGGSSAVGVESTIVELVGPEAVLLRPGGIGLDRLVAVLGEPVIDGRSGESRASGMLDSHYAPDAPVTVVEVGSPALDRLDDDVVLITPVAHPHRRQVVLPAAAEGYAEGLYRALREADAQHPSGIVVVPPTEGGPLLPAVLDRLVKASAPRS